MIDIHEFISWIDYCYGKEYLATPFDESILYSGKEISSSTSAEKELYEQLSKMDAQIEEMRKKHAALCEELTNRRKESKLERENMHSQVSKSNELSEYDTRKKYIDVELKLAGWDFEKNIVEEEKLVGMPNASGTGFADYVLYNASGKPVAVVEAKKTTVDPKVGQQQAKLYADCIEKKCNIRPVIFYTNGYETYMWDDASGYPERRIYGFKTPNELDLIIDRRTSRKKPSALNINDEISGRYYQKEAIKRVCEDIEAK